jgi:hypothetical protein
MKKSESSLPLHLLYTIPQKAHKILLVYKSQKLNNNAPPGMKEWNKGYVVFKSTDQLERRVVVKGVGEVLLRPPLALSAELRDRDDIPLLRRVKVV